MPITFDNSGFIRVKVHILSDVPGALLQGAKDIVDLASQLAPEDTGDLKRSGRIEQKSKNVIEISFGNDLPDERAIAQEYGTSVMPAQPYLTPALREVDILFHVKKALGF